MKKLLVLCLTIFMVLMACGCQKEEEQQEPVDNKLVVYTSSYDEILEVLEEAAEKALGLDIEYVSTSSAEGFARVQAERDNPQGDVFDCGGPAEINQDPTLFADYVSPHNTELPEAVQAKDGKSAITGGNTSVILWNTEKCPIEITGYADLLDPQLKGHIAFGNAASSNSAYYQLENMLVAMSTNPESNVVDEKGWEFVKNFMLNLDGKIIDSSSAVYKGVASGEYWVGLTYDTGALNIIGDGASNCKVCLMKEGVVTKTAGDAIIANCKHPENAKKYLDWLTSKEGELVTINIPGVISLRTDIEVPYYNDIGINKDTKILDCDSLWTAANKPAIVERFNKLLDEINFGA